MSKRSVLIVIVISMVVGGIIAKKYMPTIKEVQTEKVVTQTKVITVVKETKHPDGTTETETTTTDNSTKTEDRNDTKIIQQLMPQWHAGAGYGINEARLPTYSAHIERRLLGPVWLGLRASTAKEYSVTASLEF